MLGSKNIIAILMILLIVVSFLFSQEWHQIAPLNCARGGASAVALNGYIYVMGGKAEDGRILSSVERYNTKLATWDEASVSPLSYPRYNASALVFNNKIYFIGGRDDRQVIKKTEVYDPVQNLWSEAHELRNEREGFSAVLLSNSIYAIGGQKEDNEFTDEVEWYDQNEDEWEEADFDLPYPRAAFFAAAISDTFYMFGGYFYGLTSSIYIAVPGLNGYELNAGGNLDIARAYGATAQIGNNIYLIGGETGKGKTNRVDIYNIGTATFSPGKPLRDSKSGIAAAVMGDTIFAIGGFDANTGEALATVEMIHIGPTAIDVPSDATFPQRPILINAYPNPFNGKVNLKIQIPHAGEYDMAIYDLNGRKVKHLMNGRFAQKEQLLSWNGTDDYGLHVASGLFFLVIKNQNRMEKAKLVYVK